MTLSELANDLRCTDEEKALLWIFLTAFRAARLNVKPCSSFLAVAVASDRANDLNGTPEDPRTGYRIGAVKAPMTPALDNDRLTLEATEGDGDG